MAVASLGSVAPMRLWTSLSCLRAETALWRAELSEESGRAGPQLAFDDLQGISEAAGTQTAPGALPPHQLRSGLCRHRGAQILLTELTFQGRASRPTLQVPRRWVCLLPPGSSAALRSVGTWHQHFPQHHRLLDWRGQPECPEDALAPGSPAPAAVLQSCLLGPELALKGPRLTRPG